MDKKNIKKVVDVQYYILEQGALGGCGHHSLLAEFTYTGVSKPLLDIAIGISLVESGSSESDSTKKKLTLSTGMHTRKEKKKYPKVGNNCMSYEQVLANAIAAAESFGVYNYLTNNCRHYCQHLGKYLGITVYTFKSSGQEPCNTRVSEVQKMITAKTDMLYSEN